MRPICWLHISDIHMRVSDAWSQDVVLKAMCEDIARHKKTGLAPDFILVTGDLAFSGNVAEYKLVEGFFDALSVASGVPKELIFCIPGNHDIDRERQKMSFYGARHFAQSQNQIDSLLASREEMDTLIKRQSNYRMFQESYLKDQKREWTEDSLGYVSVASFDNIRLAIVGLDSAWLAEGGIDDHGKLLIGERQVINALAMATRSDPHIVISAAHHPFQLLQDFDRRPVQSRIERSCHFFHCGHLHEPEARPAGLTPSGCLSLSAGAAFETRQSKNTYSIVRLDLMHGQRSTTTVHYQPTHGTFGAEATDNYPIEIAPAGTCGIEELANAITSYRTSLSAIAHYLAALLLDQKTELPIRGTNGYAFGSLAVVRDQPDCTLKQATTQFMALKNVLRVHYKRVPLGNILNQFGGALVQYGAELEGAIESDSDLKARLGALEQDARSIAATAPESGFSHTLALLREIAQEQDWTVLQEQAARHTGAGDDELSQKATRYLALALSHSSNAHDR
jgi:predicted MPP superfamily phosphohydrolase